MAPRTCCARHDQRIVESQEVKEAELVAAGLVDRTAAAFQQSVRERKWECCARLLDIIYGALYNVRGALSGEVDGSPYRKWVRLVSTMCSVLLMGTSVLRLAHRVWVEHCVARTQD